MPNILVTLNNPRGIQILLDDSQRSAVEAAGFKEVEPGKRYTYAFRGNPQNAQKTAQEKFESIVGKAQNLAPPCSCCGPNAYYWEE